MSFPTAAEGAKTVPQQANVPTAEFAAISIPPAAPDHPGTRTAPKPSHHTSGDRLRVLDGLRWIAALSVVAYHYLAFGAVDDVWGVRPSTIFPTLSAPASFGWLGVPVFFMISGFVICMSAWGRGVSDFFVSRASRLYPAYWVSVLLVTALVALWPTVQKPLAAKDVLVNLTMMQQAVGVKHVDGVYWTLFNEFIFYLLFAVVVWRGVNYRNVTLFCMLWTVAGLLLPSVHNTLTDTIAMANWSPYFISGIVCYLIYRFGGSSLLWGILGVNWILAMLHLWPMQILHIHLLGRGVPQAAWPALVLVTIAYAVLIMISYGWLSWMKWKWLTTLGALTYPTYLLHEYAGWTAIHALVGRMPPWLIVVLVTAGVVLLAWLVHRLVERPVGRWMRRSLTNSFAKIRAQS